ncbi:hypothetical protein FisN_16Hh067 [Fistulifera solaris]|uniref:MBL fold metallo-hydrolase n=1 Tax=Fistulifera solaris TaxID=1519565 RepID=A0A1Z5KT24_FISSO|nr:hypothetical protein FisN_16Hh067 [Fistulifera solaris]|eukprot:GAX29490.1 hypothetical protein FisN_16Hh067 [Fistulifera solaris]
MKTLLFWVFSLATGVYGFRCTPTETRPKCRLSLFRKEEAMTDRRKLLQSTAAGLLAATTYPASSHAATTDFLVPTPKFDPDMNWPLGKVAFSLLPLQGGAQRATVETCIVPGQIWTYDQIQGIVNVNVPVRQTVIALQGGGLWVHNPVAPTPQLRHMMEQLIQQYGPIKHIVLGSVAVEHKATFGAFASYYPGATVWLQPGQWSFPVSLPIKFLGVRQRGQRLRELPVAGRGVTSTAYAAQAQRNPVPEWSSEIEMETLGPLTFRSVGAFSETVFYHKATKTLLVTDLVGRVSDEPPAILQQDPRALLYHARNKATDAVEDTPAARRKGWRRMALFGLVFFPSQITVSSVSQAFAEAKQVPASLRNLGSGAVPFQLYPWSWPENDVDLQNFNAFKNKLFCPPILTQLILNREVDRTLTFVDRVATRFSGMKRIIPGHLDNNIPATANDFSKAFGSLRKCDAPPGPLKNDLNLLQSVSKEFTKLGIVAPDGVCRDV